MGNTGNGTSEGSGSMGDALMEVSVDVNQVVVALSNQLAVLLVENSKLSIAYQNLAGAHNDLLQKYQELQQPVYIKGE